MNRLRFLTIAFSASVGLNVFFLGAIVARTLHHEHSQDAPELSPPPRQNANHDASQRGPVHAHVPPKRQRTGPGKPRPVKDRAGPMGTVRDLVQVMGGRKDPRVREVWQEKRETMKLRRTKRAELHAQLNEALLNDPFSEEELRAALSAMNEQASGAQNQAQEVILRLASELRPEERAQLKKLMNKRRDSHGKLR